MTRVSSIRIVAMARPRQSRPARWHIHRGHSQRCGGGLQRGDEAVEDQTEPGCVQKCRALPHNPAHGQDTACDDAIHGVWQYHGADHVPLARSHGQGSLPVGVGHGFQALLGGADDGGQDHHHQGETARQHTGLEPQHLDEEQHTHQTKDNGGMPVKVSVANSMTATSLRLAAYSVR